MSGRLYLDWNATAPLCVAAREAMIAAMDAIGNPSSIHAEGRAARALLEQARRQVAALAGCDPDQVVFTSGATEAAAMALGGRSLASSRAEHPCVAAWTEKTLQVDEHGLIALSARPAARQVANSETGVIQTPDAATVFEDAVQAFGKIAYSFARSGAQAAAVSAHKIGGPKGVGALLLKDGARCDALLRGGAQETRRRAGTENLIGIAGFGAAADAARRLLDDNAGRRIASCRDRWEAALLDVAPDAIIFGAEASRLPNTSCFAVPGWPAETHVMQLDLRGVAVSAGAACSSGKVEPSPVITAMGFAPELARAAVRVSIGPATTDLEMDRFIAIWTDLYRRRKARAA